MKTVGDVLEEISILDQQYKTISNIAETMTSDNEVAKYMYEKMKVNAQTMRNIASKILSRKYSLEDQLKTTEVKIV